jgi:hypothetical protein
LRALEYPPGRDRHPQAIVEEIDDHRGHYHSIPAVRA